MTAKKRTATQGAAKRAGKRWVVHRGVLSEPTPIQAKEQAVLHEPTPLQAKAQAVLPLFRFAAIHPDSFAKQFGDEGAALIERVYALVADGEQPAHTRVARLRVLRLWRKAFSDDDAQARGQLDELAQRVGMHAFDKTTVTADALTLARTFDPSGKGGRNRRGWAFLAALISVLGGASYVARERGEALRRVVDREAKRVDDAERKWAADAADDERNEKPAQ